MRLMLSVLLVSAALPASALDCGDRIDRDLVLSADLECRGAGAALVVVRDGVRVDLNGYAIRTSADATAIALQDVHGVEVRGPGRIEGAVTGVEAIRARGLSVRGITFAQVGEGVRLTNASHADIDGNRFERVAGHAVVALNLPGALSRGGGHRITGNDIRGAEYGVLVDAPFGRPSSIDRNRFDDIGSFGVMAPYPSVAVQDNRFGTVGLAEVLD